MRSNSHDSMKAVSPFSITFHLFPAPDSRARARPVPSKSVGGADPPPTTGKPSSPRNRRVSCRQPYRLRRIAGYPPPCRVRAGENLRRDRRRHV
jgi:hypothetical protein